MLLLFALPGLERPLVAAVPPHLVPAALGPYGPYHTCNTCYEYRDLSAWCTRPYHTFKPGHTSSLPHFSPPLVPAAYCPPCLQHTSTEIIVATLLSVPLAVPAAALLLLQLLSPTLQQQLRAEVEKRQAAGWHRIVLEMVKDPEVDKIR